jgi:alpha-tubulin suppressor-like RCC1 family protein
MGDNLPVVNVGTDKKVKEVGIGFEYTCVLLTDATVKCWGRNNDGSLGLGNTTSLGTKVGHMGDNLQPVDLGKGFSVHAISVGSIHACALSENGDVKCWGSNMDGRLGQGDGFSHGSGPGEMGDALLPVDLGVGVKAKAISAGYDHTCALLLDNRVKCWGNNDYGQLGQGDIINRGDGSGEMGENLLAVDLGTGKTAKAIIAGGQYSCAWLSDDGVKCWGRNDTGQLGQGNTMTLGDESVEMGDYLLPVLLGTDQALKQIDGIHFHSCVLRIDGTVKCWGYNLYTQLGLVDFGTVGDAPGQMGDNLPTLNLVSPK